MRLCYVRHHFLQEEQQPLTKTRHGHSSESFQAHHPAGPVAQFALAYTRDFHPAAPEPRVDSHPPLCPSLPPSPRSDLQRCGLPSPFESKF